MKDEARTAKATEKWVNVRDSSWVWIWKGKEAHSFVVSTVVTATVADIAATTVVVNF